MTKLYEARSGWPLSEGMPKSLWVAMGLQGDGMSSGWWNEFPDQVYKDEAGYDAEKADELAKTAISVSLEGFRENPKARQFSLCGSLSVSGTIPATAVR